MVRLGIRQEEEHQKFGDGPVYVGHTSHWLAHGSQNDFREELKMKNIPSVLKGSAHLTLIPLWTALSLVPLQPPITSNH